ncbi:MAG: retropepsin-like aspartic protease, partial [Planctomycetota bacterium]
MRRCVSIVGALLIVGSTQAIRGDETKALKVENVEYTSLPIVVDITRNHGMPLVDVMINGDGPYTFLIDTGAGATLVTTSFASELGLEATGTTEIGDPTDPEAVEVSTFELESLTLGDVRFETVGVTEIPDDTSHGMFQGIIGLGLVRDFTFSLDLANDALTLSDETLVEGDGSVEYILADDNLVMLDIELGEATIECHLDTGSMAPLMMPSSYLDDVTLAGELRTLGQARTVNGTFELKGARVDDVVNIAGLELGNRVVIFNDHFETGNIGSQA